MNKIELVQAIMADLNRLTLTSVKDWEIGVGLAKALIALKHALEEDAKAKEEADLKEKRAARQKQLAEAAEKGEEVIGGETIRINADGSTEVLIP